MLVCDGSSRKGRSGRSAHQYVESKQWPGRFASMRRAAQEQVRTSSDSGSFVGASLRYRPDISSMATRRAGLEETHLCYLPSCRGGAAITLLDMIRKKRCRACGAAGGGERCLKVRGAVHPSAAAEVWCLGRESNPYGLRRGIFVTLRLSPPASRSCAGLCLRRGAMRGRRPPSSLYTFSSLSLARRCLGAQARGFADFEGIHAGAFAARCSIKFKSLVSTNSTTQAAECAFYRSPLLA